jgi:hypothetical protein
MTESRSLYEERDLNRTDIASGKYPRANNACRPESDLEIAQSSQRTHKSSSEFGGTESILFAALPYREQFDYH